MVRPLSRSSKKREPAALAPSETPWFRLTRFAFVLLVVLVIARATIQEVLRNDMLPVPGSAGAPAVPGPATGLLLDLLFCVPAMLVLARRLLDGTFTLRYTWGHVAMFLLAGWTLLSVLWASDKFVASVAAAHWVAALALLWAASQLVCSWLRLRVVAAVAFGVLLVLLAQGYYYRLVDLPDFQREWDKNRAQMLAQRGAAADSFEEKQIDANIRSGEVTGFSLSRNTYAALLVLLGVVAAGAAVQRVADRDPAGWWVPVFVALALAMFMLYRFVESKTAYATPFIGAALLAVAGWKRDWIAARSRRSYWAALACFAIGVAAVVGHGLKHGTLFQLSLTYRWQYWVGAARVFVHHPWLGVGWGNFGNAYLAWRLPQAVEQPKDPHNFLVRAFVELGVVGGMLMIAWMLRLWWDFTQRPVTTSEPGPVNDPKSAHRSAMVFLIVVPVIAVALSALVAIDFTQRWEWVVLELFKRAGFLLVLVAGLGLVALRAFDDQRLDDRPAPWVLRAMIVALGLFLLHNLIDFSLFEPGPMGLFALLAGGVLGVRLPTHRPARAGTPLILVCFVVAGVAWIVAAGAGVWNVALAEGLAQDADEHVRTRNPAALQEYLDANKLVPINPDYAYRAALLATDKPMLAREMLSKAIAADPRNARYRRSLAQLERAVDKNASPAVAAAAAQKSLSDYEAAVELDPNNLEQRLEYADALRVANHPAEAKAQYERVLELNDRLPVTEIQRLRPERVAEIRERIRRL